ncbi:Lpp/OprI family alanine-zipper lipoprotein [Vibrio profundum]|uniref:Lpp/OprI family alanine-zipper lipoprotein n=1 Tax=Vibrio profundum TaxID=2910247 RepID=UPI003D0D4CFA
MNKIFLAAAASSVLLLSGCATNMETASKVDDLSNKVAELNKKVDALSSEMQKNEQSSKSAQEEASRANERIDNIAQSYTK